MRVWQSLHCVSHDVCNVLVLCITPKLWAEFYKSDGLLYLGCVQEASALYLENISSMHVILVGVLYSIC